MQARTAVELGAIIRVRRRARKLSQAEVARAAGVSRPTLGAIESGKAGAELALVLRLLAVLDLVADVVPATKAGPIDLDEYLDGA